MNKMVASHRPAKPLSQDDLQIGQRVVSRLVSELSEMLHRLPLRKLSLVDLSDYLKVDRTLCQRAMVALRQSEQPELDVLMSLPGPRGLLQFLAAARGAGAGDAEFDGLAAAIELYSQYLDKIGSQAEFGRRYAATQSRITEVDSTESDTNGSSTAGPSGGAPVTAVSAANNLIEQQRNQRALQETLYNANSALGECSVDVMTAIAILSQTSAKPFKTKDIYCTGYIGYSASAKSLPMSFHSAVHHDQNIRSVNASNVEGDTAYGMTDNCFLRDFSTSPLPTIVGIPTQNGSGVMHIVDSADWRDGRKRDIVSLDRIDRLLDRPEPFKSREVSMLISYPTRAVVFDVYVERSAFRCVTTPQIGCHVWDQPLSAQYRRQWLNMLPINVPLTVLPAQLSEATTEFYARQVELSQDIFARAGLDRSLYIGYRLQMNFPIWRAWYRVHFDFVELS